MSRIKKIVFDKARGVYQPALMEEHVVQQIMAGLAAYRIDVFRIKERMPTGKKGGWKNLSTPGLPDLFGHALRPLTGAVPVYIEVKKPGGKRRQSQIDFIDRARKAGCIAFFAESFADVERELKAAGVAI